MCFNLTPARQLLGVAETLLVHRFDRTMVILIFPILQLLSLAIPGFINIWLEQR